MANLDERVWQRAKTMWNDAGRPPGGADAYVDQASELLAIEDNQKQATRPLKAASSSGLGETLKSVKEQLRRVPNRGIGYGLLRYLCGEESISRQLEKLPQAQVSFNYLGQLDQIVDDETTPFVLADDPIDLSRSQLGGRKYLIEIDGAV